MQDMHEEAVSQFLHAAIIWTRINDNMEFSYHLVSL